jgi:hypothetical protein
VAQLPGHGDGHDAGAECVDLLAGFIAAHPEVWQEDIGEY